MPDGPGTGAEDCTRPSNCVDVDALYGAQIASLRRYVTRRVGCPDDALDLVQEAFARLLGAGDGRPAPLARPQAYLQRITRNLMLDRSRSEARRSGHLHIVADEESLAGPDLQRELESRDMLRRLETAMLKLKPRTRDIFMAHRIDGLSYAEIADRTGLSIKGVEKQMSKAIAQIDRMLHR